MALEAQVANDQTEEVSRERIEIEGPGPGLARKGLATEKSKRKVKQAVTGTLFLVLLGAGWYFPVIGYFIPLCMAAGVGLALFRGRQWCNWYCPRGSFADIFLKAMSPGRTIPRVMRSWLLKAGVLVFLMTMLGYQIVRLWPDFLSIGGFFMILLTVTTGAGVILAMVFHQRAWCSVCPIGTLSGWVGKNRRPLILNREKCVTCGACARVCPMGLEPDDGLICNKGDCLKCGLCVATCPARALSFR